ncbi:MAG: hypothetical protein HIU89_04805 [Proteobacteria bacterium]|nr:hypothetical protein [Pseudomonadota bacterium]
MSPEFVALALRKQRLQMHAAQQREACLQVLSDVETVATRVEYLQSRVQMLGEALGRHAWVLALAGVALLVVRPRGMVRWLQRGWLVYLATRRARKAFAVALAAVRKRAAS